jgi:hypothetical protein
MSIEYQIQDGGAILRVKASGTCEGLGQVERHMLRMHHAALSAGLTRIMVDERDLCYHLSTVDSFESGKMLAGLARRGLRVAVVCNPEGKEETRFWETVAVNRGAPVKVFDDVDSAEKWLGEGPPQLGGNPQSWRDRALGCPDHIGNDPIRIVRITQLYQDVAAKMEEHSLSSVH